MAESSWPTPDNARLITDLEYEQLHLHELPGILGNVGDTTVVTADGLSRAVIIRSGKYGKVHGHTWYSGSTNITKAIAANAAGSTRYDRIVLQLSRTTWNVTVEVVQGVAGAGIPAVTQNTGTTGVWQLPVAVVTVASGASVINSGDVANSYPILNGSGGDGAAVEVTRQSSLTVNHASNTDVVWTTVANTWGTSATMATAGSATITVPDAGLYDLFAFVDLVNSGTAGYDQVAWYAGANPIIIDKRLPCNVGDELLTCSGSVYLAAGTALKVVVRQETTNNSALGTTYATRAVVARRRG